jgi:hypothetical protein
MMVESGVPRFLHRKKIEHMVKWSTKMFTEGPVVAKEEFVKSMTEMAYLPLLGFLFVAVCLWRYRLVQSNGLTFALVSYFTLTTRRSKYIMEVPH